MRLHALTIDSFGPFVEPQCVDFDELGAAGVFLVHGPTGAGKTSVLDAVCYALFSDVPGARASRGLRADLAPPDRPTSVTLDFSSAGRRLRITRSPEFVRPKVRGTGLAKAPARVVLSERTRGSWVVRSTRIDEVADVVKDVLGMGLAQFQRVALLPQGQFADFLRAEPRDRHQLLTALFDVATYEEVEGWLAEGRRRHADHVAVAEHELDYHVRALTDLCGSLSATATPENGTGTAVTTLATTAVDQWAVVGPDVLARLEMAATQALGDAERAERQAAECQHAHDESVRVAGLLRRGADAEAALAVLDAAAGQMRRTRSRLDRAAQAGELRGELATLTVAERSHQEARGAADLAFVALAAVCGRPLPAIEIARRKTELTAGEHTFDQVRIAGVALRDAVRARREALAAEGGARVLLERCTAEVTAAAHRHGARATARADHRAKAADLGPAQEARARALRSHALARDLADRLDILEHLGPQLLDERTAVLDAREECLRQQANRLADLAGELAEGLHPDVPCPVCGSAQHPDPAPPATGWSPDALAAAETAVADARDRLAGLDREWHATEVVRDRLLDELVAGAEASPADTADLSTRSAADWHAAVRVQEATIRALDDRADAAAAAAAALPGITAEEEADRDEAAALSRAAARAEAGLEAAARATEATEQRLAAALDHLRVTLTDHTETCPCADVLPAAQFPPHRGELPTRGLLRAHIDIDDIDTEIDTGEIDLEDVDPERIAESLAARMHSELLAHERFATALKAAATAGERVGAAEAATAAAQAAFDAALAPSEFTDRAGVESALLGVRDVAALQQVVTDHDQQLAIHRATLDDTEVRQARALVPAPEPTRTAAALLAARDRAQRTDRAGHDTARVAREARASIARVVDGAEALITARQDLAQVAALADLTGGTSPENTLRMRLSTFVLASRLERVVDLANERLALTGDGRFRLEHDDSLAGRGARSGLGLRVRDNWSGTTRSPSSLSGGESFIASLALALGLADALRESVGGIELQTLFIDEGFGALDEASLDDVLGVLDALRDGGRAVGVVSHVLELRDRIPAQLAVRKSPQGSSLATTTPGKLA